jgi:hypothetical protein
MEREKNGMMEYWNNGKMEKTKLEETVALLG